jgi:hypothetical protein
MKRSPALVLVAGLLGASAALMPGPLTASAASAGEVDVTLNGSRASMLRQNRVAKEELYSFLRTPTQVLRFVDDGHLVEVAGNDDYDVIAGYPYARPVVRSFIERLATDYRAACGEQLVVTSLTRPSSRQPRNASPLSVHPAGMAVDLRVSARAECRDWLTAELLTLEERGLLDATREYRPPHFHVAVFPGPFQRYDQTLRAMADAEEAVRRLEAASAARRAAQAAAELAAEVRAARPVVVAAPSPVLMRVALMFARVMLPVAV